VSASSEPLLLAWLRERVLASAHLLVPLALFIALAGGTSRLPIRMGLALLALVVFRLWDDLEDIDHDRREHPERVLCRATSLASVRLAFRLLLGLTIVCLAFLGSRLPFFAALLLLLATYAARRRMPRESLRVLFAHGVLLKVPLLALALAADGPSFPFSLGCAIALFGIAAGYELLHDREARRSPFAPALAFFDIACLLAGLSLGYLYFP